MSNSQSDNPLDPSPEHLQRIRLRAYHLWESEGRPEGQSAEYWERARELDALQSDAPGMLPNPLVAPPRPTFEGVLIEEASLQANLGEFTELGETMSTPETPEIAREFRDGER